MSSELQPDQSELLTTKEEQPPFNEISSPRDSAQHHQQQPRPVKDKTATMGASQSNIAQPVRAMIYRGKNACEYCPESVGELFQSTFPKVQITYAGPDEKVKINADTLSQVDVYAQPGGPDVDDAFKEAEPYASALRDFVAGGGRYVGFCLGAYMAGHDPGFSLLPPGDDVSQEIEEPGSQVDDEDDTIIQVDWTFATGEKQNQTERKRWVYFQDGPMFNVSNDSPATVLARYSSTGDVAAMLNQYGDGWVANIGPHPEANEDWYDDEEITNPEGVKFDIGHDFLRVAMEAK